MQNSGFCGGAAIKRAGQNSPTTSTVVTQRKERARIGHNTAKGKKRAWIVIDAENYRPETHLKPLWDQMPEKRGDWPVRRGEVLPEDPAVNRARSHAEPASMTIIPNNSCQHAPHKDITTKAVNLFYAES